MSKIDEQKSLLQQDKGRGGGGGGGGGGPNLVKQLGILRYFPMTSCTDLRWK